MYSKIIGSDDSDEIVISGISGVFPNSENVHEFKENLLAGNDMIAASVSPNATELAFALLKTTDRFDYSFFRMSHNQANVTTIATRLLLEKSFEAILDAGYNPQEIKGKNIAVIGGIWDTVDDGDPSKAKKVDDYTEVLGRMIFMMTSRISSFLDVHGPCYTVNTACSSSLYAMDQAIKAIRTGQCEGALVCSANLCFTVPCIGIVNLLLSTTTNSAPFDIDANGYVRAEAASVLFLQKKKYARRIYANIIHSTTNCDGFKTEGITFPSITQQIQLYNQFYKEINMDPKLISYIETHGTGTQVGDVVEGTSIDEFFCANRTTPLKIGTVKSNMGHGEATAALCGMIKMIIAFETGIIPANLRFHKPNPQIKGLFNGHLEVITKPTPVEGEFFALNAFGIGGSNGHIVVSPYTKIKREDETSIERLPVLVTASGRTEEAVDCILNNVEQNQNDAEYIRLWHEIFKHDINGHLYRGYTILQKNKEAKISKKNFSGEKRPIWFVFSGMGSQWPGMGKSLMKIPIFAESIHKSHQILQSKGLDLLKIITDDDPKMFDNILNSFVGIAAIQIALVDVLRALNIKPDGIVGHSVGELGCAYADGCFTAEQMILAAYSRGSVSLGPDLIHGTMAAVGLSYESMKNLVPPEIDIACHNGPTSCTLSGPTEIMKNFIRKLKEKKIFVREVYVSNIAYHSRYINPIGPGVLSYMKTIIPEPKLRSEKWICTSAPEHKWNCNEAKYASAEYFTNNLLNPVLFEESYQYIPNNAINIEIGPHGLLNAILKYSLPTTVDNIPLAMRNYQDGVEYLLIALGRLYEMGCDMELSHLYPSIEFPVSKSTPMISPLIKWQHDEQWQINEMTYDGFHQSYERSFFFNQKNEENEYIRDHIIDGRNLYPGFGYLWLVVETISMIENKKVTEVSVAFENVHFEHALILRDKGSIYFYVSIHKLNKYFEVRGDGVVVATGKVRILEKSHKEMIKIASYKDEISSDTLPLRKDDFYKELQLRGYHYKTLFKNVEYVNSDGEYGEISWGNNFVCFMDSMAQTTILHMDCRSLLVPTFIKKVVIDFEEHFKILDSLDKDNPKFSVNFYRRHGVLRSGGVQLCGFKGTEIARQKNANEPIHEKYQFVPYITDKMIDLNSAVKTCVQIAIKSMRIVSKAITYELLDPEYDPELAVISSAIATALNDTPSVEPNVNVLINSEKMEETHTQDGINISNQKLPKDKSAAFVVVSNIQNKIDLYEAIFETLKDGGFIITTVPIEENIHFENLGFNVYLSRIISNSEKIVLLNKKTEPIPIKRAVQIRNDTYSWVGEIQKILSSNSNQDTDNKLIIFAEKEPTSGILGFFNCLLEEQKGSNINCFFIMDETAPVFSPDNPFYKSQLDKNLLHNVYKNGEWGSYWHLALDTKTEVESSHAFCMLEERGNLSTFKWVQGQLEPSKYENSNGRSLAYVYYSSINFKDVMLSVGRISLMDSFSYNRLIECYQGSEFSGRNENGERLMGIVNYKGIATMVETIPQVTWRVPNRMTLEEAASIPVVYSTVIYAFFFKIQLMEGCSILIHCGSGGIGQAAINICLHYKCNIFTTVGTPEKMEFIKKTFPQIPESHIGNSRDTSFLEMIREQTDGKGVDVVLNSLAEDKLLASIHCVAEGGHFLEIGKFDMAKNNYLELGHFLNDISFHSVQFDIFLMKQKTKKIFAIRDKLQEMLDQGIIKPINRTVFQVDEIESAFRYMSSGKHIGKLMIKLREEEQDLKSKPTVMHMKANARLYCHEAKSYVILGGLGGIGMELVDWLVIRGARNIVLSSRTGVKNGYQSYRINLWRSYGVNVVISTSNISQESGVKEILETAICLGPVAGIFNLAMVLKDGEFLNQTEEDFRMVVEPKAIATGHLDRLSRKMCPNLEHFVMFSSVTCGYGYVYQTNYGFANSVIERICELRSASNLPGMAIEWGPIAEVGYTSDLYISDPSVVSRFDQQKLKSCLETMNRLMVSPNPIVSSILIAEKRKTDSDIITTVANILRIKDLKTVSLTWTLTELGMDSILAIELKQILDAEFNVFLTAEDLRTMTFAKLLRLKEKKLKTPTLGANKVTTEVQFIMNENLGKQIVLRIPLIGDTMQERLPINENPTVFVFPGAEGIALAMEPLAKNLGIQTLCFQYHFIDEFETIQKLSATFSSHILQELSPENEFCLIGYSGGGATIAMEVAKILEKSGRKGRIWLIEGSPAVMQLTFTKVMQDFSCEKVDEIAQNQICMGMITRLLPELPKEDMTLSKRIEDATDWESKKKVCASILSKITKRENIDQRLFVLDTYFNMLKAVSKYEKVSIFSLQSPCVLIRCVENYLNLPLDESYGLTQYFKNLVNVHKIDDVDHISILSHPKTADIIMNSLPRKEE